MNDYNRGALPDPCLRLDYGFGEQWASVELGDGTGYVRLDDCERALSENAMLRELENIRMSQVRHCEDLDKENSKLREQVTQLQGDLESERDYADQMEAKEKKAVAENDKLRELARGLHWCNDKQWNKGACDDCPIRGSAIGRCERAMRELGIEVDK